MRTLVDIPEPELRALTEIGARRKVSRAAVIREAIANYLERNRKPHEHDPIDNAFGLWGKGGDDGLEYQRKLRDEW